MVKLNSKVGNLVEDVSKRLYLAMMCKLRCNFDHAVVDPHRNGMCMMMSRKCGTPANWILTQLRTRLIST